MRIRRRTFFKIGAAAGAAALASRPREASAAVAGARVDTPAVLVDTTKCVGCRACEAACAEANGLAGPALAGDDRVYDSRRDTGTQAFTVVNRYEAKGAPVRFAKKQCMHCLDPGCASACIARAIEKTPEGPVVYHGEHCLGCRYCMVACPFDVPKFEYESAAPYIRKCTFCAGRQANGLAPACTSVCPSGALTFGTRDALLEEARERLYRPGGQYVRHVYGEREAGGTSWLYISDRPLDQLGFKSNVLMQSIPSLTQPALAAVPFILTLWPPLLMGLYTFSQKRAQANGDRPGGTHAADPEEVRHA